MTARLWTLRKRIIGVASAAGRKFHPIKCLTLVLRPCYSQPVCAVPAAHEWPLLCEAGPEDSFAHVWLRCLCAPGAGGAGVWDRRNRLRSSARGRQPARKERPADPAPVLRRLLGHHLREVAAVSARRARYRDVPA